MRFASLVVALSIPAFAVPPKPNEIPSALREWVPWVMHHERAALCPFLHNSDTRACAWPGRLALTLDE
ncbi:MAG: hypothetical protein JNM17_10665, partial [Archangium sp.]|nr:hypothetical protein [Archangium sp.]